jgi:hypothetical protein
MWTIIAEKPLLLAAMLGTVALGLLYGWLQTGNRRIGAVGVVFALLVPGAFILADRIVTDREKILQLIDRAVEAVENNDHQAAVAAIGVPAVRQQALQELPQYEFTQVRVRNIQINLVAGSFPPEATADCDASARVSLTRGSIKNMRVARRVILTFRQEPDGSWIIIDYTHRPLTGGVDTFTPRRP